MLRDYLTELPLIAILRGLKPEEAEGVVGVLIEHGMTAIEIRDPAVDITTLLHLEGEDWSGIRIADLREVLSMV